MVSLQLCLPSLDAHSANGHIQVNQGRGRCLSGASHHQADIKPTSSEVSRRIHGGCTLHARKGTLKTANRNQPELPCHQPSSSPILLPPYPCIWQGVAKLVEPAWTWEVLGYSLGRAWVHRICTLGVPCQKRTTTKIDSRNSRIQEGQHHDC